jgi:hypothetical protein
MHRMARGLVRTTIFNVIKIWLRIGTTLDKIRGMTMTLNEILEEK